MCTFVCMCVYVYALRDGAGEKSEGVVQRRKQNLKS